MDIIIKDGKLYRRYADRFVSVAYDFSKDPEDWITINGSHVELGEGGQIVGGAGGKFNGSTYKGTQKAKHTAQKTSTAKTAGNKDVRVKLKNGVTLRWQEVPGEPDKVYNPETREMYAFKGGLKAAIEKAKNQGATVEEYENQPKDPYANETTSRESRKLASGMKHQRRAAKRGRPVGAR